MSKSDKKKGVTIQDIAERVNISSSTVSRALNNHPKISQKTKEKIWAVAKELGYLPNIPIYMQKKKSNIVALLVDNARWVRSCKVISSVQECLSEEGFYTIIKLMSPGERLSKDFLQKFKDMDVVGVVSMLDDTHNLTIGHQEIVNLDFPLVTINTSSSIIPSVNVVPDIYNGAYLAAKHLQKSGAKNILLVIGEEEHTLFTDMEEGFKAAFVSDEGYGVLKSNLSKRGLRHEFEKLWKKKSVYDAVIACDNFVVNELCVFLNAKKIIIPNEVMLISFGNERNVSFISPEISAVEYSLINMGTVAAKQLIEVIHGNPIESQLLIEPVKIIMRASSMRV